MLMSSLTAESDSVFIDLLTYADLELLKSRKMGKPGPASSASKSNNKRYLIMTYAVEYMAMIDQYATCFRGPRGELHLRVLRNEKKKTRENLKR